MVGLVSCCRAGLLVIAAVFTVARTVPGAWALGGASLFSAIMIVVLRRAGTGCRRVLTSVGAGCQVNPGT